MEKSPWNVSSWESKERETENQMAKHSEGGLRRNEEDNDCGEKQIVI